MVENCMVVNNNNAIRKDVDTLEQQTKVTQTIDNYNLLTNPLTFQAWTNYSTLTQTNWILDKSNNSIQKAHGTQDDTIQVDYSTLPQLEHKIITGIEIITDITIEDTSGVFNGMYPKINSIEVGDGTTYSAIIKDEDGRLNSSTLITEDYVNVKYGGKNNLWGYNSGDLDNIVNNKLFSIRFNVDLSTSGKTLIFKNTYIKFYFDNFFQTESEAVANRLDLIQYSFLNTSNSLFTLEVDNGYLYEEYYSADVPSFAIIDGNLVAEGNNLPNFKFENGYLYVGDPENCELTLTLPTTATTSDTVNIEVLFTNDSGLAVEGETVSISYSDGSNPETYEINTNSSGVATKSTQFFNTGDIEITASFNGDNYFNKKTVKKTITITGA